jgi:hypothetical protein
LSGVVGIVVVLFEPLDDPSIPFGCVSTVFFTGHAGELQVVPGLSIVAAAVPANAVLNANAVTTVPTIRPR